MKLTQKEKREIKLNVHYLEIDVHRAMPDIKCKKEKSMFSKIMNHGEEIVMGIAVLFLFFITLENMSISNALEGKSNNRSPAVVEMYIAE